MSKITMTSDEIATLLGRSLSDEESKDFDNLLSDTVLTLEQILGVKLQGERSVRKYNGRKSYRMVFTDLFTGTPKVTVNGKSVESTPSYFDDMNARWFNCIELPSGLESDCLVSVEANWGVGDTTPSELKRLLANVFTMQTEPVDADNQQLSSESILSHSVSYSSANSPDALDRFMKANRSLINLFVTGSNGKVEGDYLALPRLD